MSGEPLPRELAVKMMEAPYFFKLLSDYAAHTMQRRKDALAAVQDEVSTSLIRGELIGLKRLLDLRQVAEKAIESK